MTNERKKLIACSNNKKNPNKNVCVLAVTKALGVDNNVRYLHNIKDVVRAIRTKYKVRSRLSAANAYRETVGSIRKKLEKLDGDCYLIRVKGHAILLNRKGETIVDTAPRKRDKRKITHLYAVSRKN